jgi:hypothetical protein
VKRIYTDAWGFSVTAVRYTLCCLVDVSWGGVLRREGERQGNVKTVFLLAHWLEFLQ